MYDKFYFYLTEAFLRERAHSAEELASTWRNIARRGDSASFEDVRDGTGAVTWKNLEVKLVGCGENRRGNVELITAGGFVIEVFDKTGEEAI